jgi:hypothetical protein
MSAETKADLERALRAHVNDEAAAENPFVVNYLVGVEYVSAQLGADGTGMLSFRPDEQSWTTSVGIALALQGAYLPARPTYLIDT